MVLALEFTGSTSGHRVSWGAVAKELSEQGEVQIRVCPHLLAGAARGRGRGRGHLPLCGVISVDVSRDVTGGLQGVNQAGRPGGCVRG